MLTRIYICLGMFLGSCQREMILNIGEKYMIINPLRLFYKNFCDPTR